MKKNNQNIILKTEKQIKNLQKELVKTLRTDEEPYYGLSLESFV